MQQTKQRIKKRGYKYILVSVFVLLWGILGVYNTSFALNSYTLSDYSIYDCNSNGWQYWYANQEITDYTSTEIPINSAQYVISSEWFFSDNYFNYQNTEYQGHYLFLDTLDDNAYPPPSCLGTLGTSYNNGIVDITGLSNGRYFIHAYNSYEWLFFEMYNGEIIGLFNPLESFDNFTITATLPDTTSINSGYDYIGNDFNNIGISLDGTNSLGLYDTFRIKTYKDGILVGTTYEIPINVSCITCNLGSFIMGDLGIDFTQYSEYLFNISMDSILADSIPKEFIISYDLIGNQVIYEDCTTVDLFCYIKNAFRWAFFIPPSTFDKFTGLKDTLSMKAPFGYISAILDELGNINNDTGNEVFVLEEVTPITDNIFSPIRTALMWLLYFTFAFMLFNRFKDIQI